MALVVDRTVDTRVPKAANVPRFKADRREAFILGRGTVDILFAAIVSLTQDTELNFRVADRGCAGTKLSKNTLTITVRPA